MKNRTRGFMSIALAAGVFTGAVHAQTTAATTDSARNGVTETVFTMTNDGDRNQVVAFESDRSGAFREARRFDTGGRGSGGNQSDTLQAQNPLLLSQDRSLLFAVNPGSAELSVFRIIGDDLILTQKLPTGGALPVSVAQRGNRVYVLNQGSTGVITGFDLESGRLRRIPNATGFLSGPLVAGVQVGISPDGQFLVAIEQLPQIIAPALHLPVGGGNYIDTYKINPDGSLGPATYNFGAGTGSFSFLFTPAGRLIVTNAGVASSSPQFVESGVSSYSILPSGKLSTITANVPSGGLATCWNVLTADGKRTYAVSTVTGDISGYFVAPNGALSAMPNTVLASNPTNSFSTDLALDGTGKYLYNLNPTSNTIGVFAVNADGTLRTLTPIDVPNAIAYAGLAAL